MLSAKILDKSIYLIKTQISDKNRDPKNTQIASRYGDIWYLDCEPAVKFHGYHSPSKQPRNSFQGARRIESKLS